MNYRNSNTQGFSMGSHLTRAEQKRRRRRRLIILLVVLLIIAAALVLAVVFIVRDLTGANRTTEPNVDTLEPGTADAHPTAYAYDSDDGSYYLSPSDQTEGAWFRLTLDREADVKSVGILSYHNEYYIRSAEIQLSADGQNWTSVGEYTGTPNNSVLGIIELAEPVRAQYVRVLIAMSANKPYALNTVAVNAADGSPVGIRSSMSGSSGADPAGPAPVETTAQKSGWEYKPMGSADVHTGDLILVSNQYQYIFPASTANILQVYYNRNPITGPNGEVMYSYTTGDIQLVTLDAKALVHLNSMIDDFFNASGINQMHVGPNGGYRSFETQQDLANKYPASAAVPGYSEHHTGLSVDLDIFNPQTGATYSLSDSNAASVAAFNWLRENAYKYGYVRRYADNKSTVTGMSPSFLYRYVSYPHAYFMTKYNGNDLCLEEYLFYLAKNYEYSDKHLEFAGDDGHKYEIYYVAAEGGNNVTNVPVPVGKEYTVSGDNYSGFIVTITK